MEERERELKNIFSVRQLGESRIRMVSAHTSHMQWPQALVCVCEEPPAHSTSRQGRPVAGAHTHTLTKCLETWRPDVQTACPRRAYLCAPPPSGNTHATLADWLRAWSTNQPLSNGPFEAASWPTATQILFTLAQLARSANLRG